MTIRLIIVSDIRLYREGLEQALSADARFCIVGTAVSVEEAIQRINTTPFDIILVDISMDVHDSILRQIVAQAPAAKILALAVPESTTDILACLEAGVAGYVTRASSLEDLVQSILALARGELPRSPQLAGFLLQRLRTLTIERGKVRENGVRVEWH